MVNMRPLPDFRIANGNGETLPFREFLADFNILAIRRGPVPSHGPATKLLQRLLAENFASQNGTARGFDIRSPDRPCELCRKPRFVFTESDLATICDSDGSIWKKFGVVGYDRFFVVMKSGPQVIDVGSLEEISRSGMKLGLEGACSPLRIARAPPESQYVDPGPAVFDERIRVCHASS